NGEKEKPSADQSREYQSEHGTVEHNQVCNSTRDLPGREWPRAGAVHAVSGDVPDVIPRVAYGAERQPRDGREQQFLGKRDPTERDPAAGQYARRRDEEVRTANQPQDG